MRIDIKLISSLVLLTFLAAGCSKGPDQYATGEAASPEAPNLGGNSVTLPIAVTTRRDENKIVNENTRKPIIYGEGLAGISFETAKEESLGLLSTPQVELADGRALYRERMVIYWRTQDPKVPEAFDALNGYLGRLNLEGLTHDAALDDQSSPRGLQVGTSNISNWFDDGDERGLSAVRKLYNSIEKKAADFNCIEKQLCDGIAIPDGPILLQTPKLWLFVSKDAKRVSSMRLFDASPVGQLNNQFDLVLGGIFSANGKVAQLGDEKGAVSSIIGVEEEEFDVGMTRIDQSLGSFFLGYSKSNFDRDYKIPSDIEKLELIYIGGVTYKKPIVLNGKYISVKQAIGQPPVLTTKDKQEKSVSTTEIRSRIGEKIATLTKDNEARTINVVDHTDNDKSHLLGLFPSKGDPTLVFKESEKVIDYVSVKTANGQVEYELFKISKESNVGGKPSITTKYVRKENGVFTDIVPQIGLKQKLFEQFIPRGEQFEVASESTLTFDTVIHGKSERETFARLLTDLIKDGITGVGNTDMKIDSQTSGLFLQNADHNLTSSVMSYDTKTNEIYSVFTNFSSLTGKLRSVGVSKSDKVTNEHLMKEVFDPYQLPIFLGADSFKKSSYAKSLSGFKIGGIISVSDIDNGRKEANISFKTGSGEISSRAVFVENSNIYGIYAREGNSVKRNKASSISFGGLGLTLKTICSNCDKGESPLLHKIIEIRTGMLASKITNLCGIDGFNVKIGDQARPLAARLRKAALKAVDTFKAKNEKFDCTIVENESADGLETLSSIYLPQQRLKLFFSDRELSEIAIYGNPSEVLK